MVKVYSKIKLSSKLEAKISEVLTSKLGKIEIVFEIDESILSGIKIDDDSEIIDLTLNSRLEKIFEAIN